MACVASSTFVQYEFLFRKDFFTNSVIKKVNKNKTIIYVMSSFAVSDNRVGTRVFPFELQKNEFVWQILAISALLPKQDATCRVPSVAAAPDIDAAVDPPPPVARLQT